MKADHALSHMDEEADHTFRAHRGRGRACILVMWRKKELKPLGHMEEEAGHTFRSTA